MPHYYGRDRIATLFPDAQARTMHEWARPRGNAVYYGRDPAKTLIRLWTGPHFTLFSMDGSAPKHSLLWAGPRRALITMGGPAPGHSLLWDGPAPGPHRALITMGGPAPGHSLLWAGPQRARIPMGGPATPFGPYKSNFQKVLGRRPAPQCKASVLNLPKSDNIVSQACAQKVFHYAFCMYTLSARFANVLMMQGIYHRPGTRAIWTGHTSNFLVHGEHARTC